MNASDNRGKADSQIGKGIGGSTANSVKELISNESLGGNLDRYFYFSACLSLSRDGLVLSCFSVKLIALKF